VRRRAAAAALVAGLLAGGLAACGDDAAPVTPWPGPEPTLRLGEVPLSAVAPVPLPARRDGEVSPAAEWPAGCDLFRESDATTIVPQTSHQRAEEIAVGPARVSSAGPGEPPVDVRLPRGGCRRQLWFAYGQPGDRPDVWVEVVPVFVGGPRLARAHFERHPRPQPCPPAVDRRIVNDCSYDPDSGNVVAVRNGVVVEVFTTFSGQPRGRWEGQAGEGTEPWRFAWVESVLPRLVTLMLARVP
jgi:hypothetical protein